MNTDWEMSAVFLPFFSIFDGYYICKSWETLFIELMLLDSLTPNITGRHW